MKFNNQLRTVGTKYAHEIFITLFVWCSCFYFLLQTKKISSLGFPFDDSWIHAHFARNLVNFHVLSFNPPFPSLGTTSLLWVLLLACGYVLTQKIVWVSLGIGIGATWLLALACYKLTQKIFTHQNLACITTLLFVSTGTLYFHALSGLETNLFLALGILALLTFTNHRYWLTSFLIGLLILTRIEGILLLPVCLFLVIFHKHTRPSFPKLSVPVMKLLIPASSIILLNLFFNFLTAGTLLPSTFQGKQWLFLNTNTNFSFEKNILGFWQQWFWFITNNILFAQQPIFFLFPVIVLLASFLVVCGLGKVVLALKDFYQPQQNHLTLIAFSLWWLCHNGAYQLVLPWPGNVGRYQFLNVLMFWLLVILGIQCCLPNIKNILLRTSFHYVLLILFFTINIYSLCFWATIYSRATHHINSTHQQAGIFIAQHLPKSETIAAFDIGAIGFFSQHSILDLGCLTGEKTCMDFLSTNNIAMFLLNKKPAYLAMPESADYQDFLDLYQQPFFQQHIKKTLLQSYAVDYYDDTLATSNAFPRVSVYALEYLE